MSPSELVIDRRMKTHLGLFRLGVQNSVLFEQTGQRKYHDIHAQDRDADVKDDVNVSNYTTGKDK